MAGWRDLEQGAPKIARLGMARLAAVPVAMLGTVRPDGSPRISPVEPCLAGGQLFIGAMAWSGKAADLHRDPRYVLHSVVTGPDTGEGEFKVYGSAAPAGPATPRRYRRLVVRAPGSGGRVRAGHRDGAVHRMGPRARRDDHPPVEPAKRLPPQHTPLPVTRARCPRRADRAAAARPRPGWHVRTRLATRGRSQDRIPLSGGTRPTRRSAPRWCAAAVVIVTTAGLPGTSDPQTPSN
jgi:hypothetical protein